MRTSYTVTLPEEPPAAPFPALAKELRPRSPLSPSLLLSTFVGLLLNKAKVRGALFRDPHAEGWGSASLPGCPTPAPFHRAPARPGHRFFPVRWPKYWSYSISPSKDSSVMTSSPSLCAWRPDFPGAAREAP